MSTHPEGYTVPPPGYVAAPAAKKGTGYGATADAGQHEPLLGTSAAAGRIIAGEGAAARNVWAEDGDGLEDDFKASLPTLWYCLLSLAC